jgi:eukaryotic-like serine/threonine-protein kinase
VREEEPLTPSAQLRSLELSSKDVRGDLDWIVMRCLEKEPARRYQTVNDLLLDIQRHLRHEAVDARPPSVVYTLHKFARRNRMMFAATLAGSVFIVAFAVNTSIQAQRVAGERARVEQERQRGERVAGFMLETLAKAEPFGYAETGRPETAKELVDRAARWVRQDTSQRPALRAQLLESVARAYRRRGEDRDAVGFLQEALELRRQLAAGGDDLATAEVMVWLAAGNRQIDNLVDCDHLLQQAAAMLHRLGAERSLLYARVLMERGRLELRNSRNDRALKHLNESLALARDVAGPRDIAVAEVLAEQTSALIWMDDLPAAEHAAREAVDIYSASPKLHPDRVDAEWMLGEVLREQSKFREANAVLGEVLDSYRKIYGERNHRVANTLDSLARNAFAQHRFIEAEAFARQAVDCGIDARGTNDFQTAMFRTQLALIQNARGKHAEAESQLRAALVVFESSEEHQPYRAAAEYHLGVALLATHRLKEAEAYFQAAMNRAQRAGEAEWRVARAASGLGEALYVQGRAREAEPYLVNSYRIVSSSRNADGPTQEVVRDRVARFYTERGEPDRLQALTHGPLHVDAAP